MIKFGSKVKYVRNDTEEDKATGMYPPIGTYGTVVDIGLHCCKVKWNEGTMDGAWWCDFSDVEEVYHPTTHGAVEAVRIFMDERGITPMAELAFAYGGTAIIRYDNVKERALYYEGINAYTYIYDERIKREFSGWIKTKESETE